MPDLIIIIILNTNISILLNSSVNKLELCIGITYINVRHLEIPLIRRFETRDAFII